MLSVWKWPARLALAAMVATAPASARAADIYDAWINVFEIPNVSIGLLSNETRYNDGGQQELQIIKGTSQGRLFQINLQRTYGSSSVLPSYDSAPVDNATRNAKGMAARFKLPEGEVREFQQISGRGGRGATIDRGNCRFGFFGFRGNATGSGFEIIVDGMSCGDKAAFSNYLAQTIARSDRAANLAARAASAAPAPASAPATPSAKPALQVNCEAAKGDNGRLATFMQSLSQAQLAQFLARSQDCTTFSGT